jgi:ABC-type Fe3+-hydroxamate transport system substrate-binding protein
MTAAQNTFIDEIITLAGGINITCPTKIRYPIYSLEEIVNQNPEVIIITEMGEIGLQAKKDWAKFTELTAVKEDNVIVLNAQETHNLCAPTPLGFAQAVEKMAQYLHPIK